VSDPVTLPQFVVWLFGALVLLLVIELAVAMWLIARIQRISWESGLSAALDTTDPARFSIVPVPELDGVEVNSKLRTVKTARHILVPIDDVLDMAEFWEVQHLPADMMSRMLRKSYGAALAPPRES
jgi:hypothetical protein